MARTAENQITRRPQTNTAVSDFDDRGKKFTTFINSNAIKNLLTTSLGGPQAAAQVTSTLIAQVSANPKLQQCQPMTILAAALRGEVGMGLSLVLGDYAIVPYGDQASFQLQVNGLKRLCLNSKAYAKINCFDVREGEFKGRDPMTREPVIKWIEDDDLREQLPIVGYYAFYILNSDYNGFSASIYWTHDKIMGHADRYSKAFSLDKYKALLAGELSEKDAKWLRNGTPWYDDPNAEPHMKMCAKTVIKQLLGDGFAPKSTVLQNAITADNAEEKNAEPVIYADEFDRMAREAALEAAREPVAKELPQGKESVPEAQNAVKTASRAPQSVPQNANGQRNAARQAAAPAPKPANAPIPMDSGGELPFNLSDEDDPLA
jgi:recombination protein RecT